MSTIKVPKGREPVVESFTLDTDDGAPLPMQRFTPSTSIFPTPTAAVIVIHNFVEHHGRWVQVGRYLASQGLAALTWTQRGFGDRRWGEYTDASWDVLFADMDWVIGKECEYLKKTYGEGKVPLYLYGHSMVSR